MKKTILIGAFLLICGAGVAENKTVRFAVNPPLVCNNCENRVKDNFRFEKGIKSIKPSAKKGEVVITYDDAKTDIPTISAGFERIGYQPELLDSIQ